MSIVALIAARASRLLSPSTFVFALICCAFTFAGVSCNTTTAKQAASSFAGLGGGAGAGLQQAALNACLDALNGTNLLSYSGFTLMLGGSPAQVSHIPATCQQGATPGSNQPVAPTDFAIPAQPLGVGALAVMGAGVLAGVAGLGFRARRRLLLGLCMLLGTLAFVLLLFNQLHAHTVISRMLDGTAAGRGAPFSVAEFFTVNDGVAWMLALAALGLGVVYNGVAILALAGAIPEQRATDVVMPPRANDPAAEADS